MQSPYLNPIKHLWGELQRRLRERYSHPTSDLTDALLRKRSYTFWKNSETVVVEKSRSHDANPHLKFSYK